MCSWWWGRGGGGRGGIGAKEKIKILLLAEFVVLPLEHLSNSLLRCFVVHFSLIVQKQYETGKAKNNIVTSNKKCG